ncbi:MAG: nucleotidyltransferase domain-containing protein [Clostridiales bacterium]|nr:nucleotidyltransferase domain-containing protein [Clostridiales bacterium]
MSENPIDTNFNQIVNALRQLNEVDAVALGGSRATGCCDGKSDYDIYVYCASELTPEKRGHALAPFCRDAEIGNRYWESEDNCVMNNGVNIDIIYRDLTMFERYLKAVVEDGTPFNGYTTCFWHNIVTCKALFDKSGNFSALQKKYTVPYPEKLKHNIIENNRKLLSGTLPSYDKQIKKAEMRNDLVSVHHRITEFLASCFDIIFAVNEITHPGEKRLTELCVKLCRKLPDDFEENIKALLASVTNGNSYEIAEKMVLELDKILE